MPSGGFASRVQTLLTPQEAAAPTTMNTAPSGTLCARPAAIVREAGEGHDCTAELKARRPLAEEGDGQRDREHGLQLDHERREPRRHADVDGDEEQPELADAEKEPDDDDPFQVDGGSSYEENGRERRQCEAESDEEQRRERLEADIDREEVDTPQERDRRGEGAMAKRHWRSTE